MFLLRINGYTTMDKIWLFNIVTVGFLIVGRLFVPTVIDASPTSLYKDMAHIYWGIIFTMCFYTKDRSLIALTILSALWELGCALLGVGGSV